MNANDWSTDIGAAPINTPLLVQLRHHGRNILTVVEISQHRLGRVEVCVTMPDTDSGLYSLVPIESITHWMRISPP